MNVVKLEIGNSLPGSLSLKLTREGSARVDVETAEGFTLEQLATDLDSLEQLLPLDLSRELQQWVHDDTSPGLLAIVSEDPHLDGIPWEFLPKVLQLSSVSVVRLLENSDLMPNGTGQDQLRLLAA